MKNVTFTMDDATYAATEAALCANYGYQTTIRNPNFNSRNPVDPITNPEAIPNPQSAVDFATGVIQKFVGDNIRQYQAGQAVESARQIALAAANAALAAATTTVTIV